jgi:hypothetical protein
LESAISWISEELLLCQNAKANGISSYDRKTRCAAYYLKKSDRFGTSAGERLNWRERPRFLNMESRWDGNRPSYYGLSGSGEDRRRELSADGGTGTSRTEVLGGELSKQEQG